MAARKRKASCGPCIPGLVPEAFLRGSRHSAPTPDLIKHEVDSDGSVHFEWQAKGSLGAYKIEATGKLETILKDNKIVVKGLKVRCSCPDGDRQALKGMQSDEAGIIVCKHGAAALESVLDKDALTHHKNRVEQLKKEQILKEARREQEEKAAKEEQERQMPGERGRIEYGLEALTADEILKHAKNAAKTVDGLQALATIFPASIMPIPETQHCMRCNKTYDPRYVSQRICRMEHPCNQVRTEWDGSKKSWQHCERCDGDFYPNGTWGRNAPHDVGEWCFQGEHTTDEQLVQEEAWDETGDY